MTEKIVVLGSTGAQGGSVSKYLASKGYHVLAGTRDPTSELAKAVKSEKITPIKIDFDDKEQLTSVFKQASLLFAVTNFWGLLADKRGPYQAEIDHGRNIIHAAKKAGVKHIIFSTLESATEASKGKLQVPHFDSKGVVEEELKKSGVPFTILRTTFYYQNFLTFFPISEDGLITLPMKDKELPFYDVRDTGGIVYGILTAGDKYKNKTIGSIGDSLNVTKIAQIFSEETGRNVKYNKITAENFAALKFPGADEMAKMFLFFTDYPMDRDLDLTKSLYPGLKDFRSYIKENADVFKLKK